MPTLILLLLTLLAGYKPAAPPTLEIPLLMTIRQTVGMAPFTLRVKVRAAVEGREVCVVVDGPESFQSCRTLYGITWTQDFILRVAGTYAAFAYSESYRTSNVTIRVIGEGESQ